MISIPFNGQTYILPDEIIGIDNSKYRILEMLGRGGNGSVFECENAATGETFALKVLLNLKTPRSERFEREIQVISRLSHEHIVTYITHGRMSISSASRRETRHRNRSYSSQFDVSFIIMRKADSNLREFLTQSSSPLRFEDYYGQFVGLAKALEKLHAVAMHRDIKPDNILISADVWQISDFGLCALIEETKEQLTKAEEAVGPRYWMSPEAVSKAMGLGDVINCCSDLFQLASVFWFVVTRRPPIGILTMDDWSGPPSLGQLLLDTLQHNPLRRPRSTTEFLQKLEEVKFS
ncbi:protein kinase [Leptolyngbya sp. NK1-12]|uniref:Protein kinase n=1 Tax=Leptolyngbya sp. NK1-12 TaxID=2547451 RepID=A0AA97AJU9_9CYAN|nr:protein kinase [Leptolyngbya sp. NK1-12]